MASVVKYAFFFKINISPEACTTKLLRVVINNAVMHLHLPGLFKYFQARLLTVALLSTPV